MNPKQQKKSPLVKKADLLLIFAVALVTGVIALILLMGGRTGDTVTVEIDGKIVDRLPLSVDAEKEYAGASGGVNRLVIKDGKARIAEADCPDKICARHRPVSRGGESIICLPHKLVVTVERAKPADGVDAAA